MGILFVSENIADKNFWIHLPGCYTGQEKTATALGSLGPFTSAPRYGECLISLMGTLFFTESCRGIKTPSD